MKPPAVGEVHVWAVAADGATDAAALAELSPDERRRHAGLRHAPDRELYAVAHSALRRHLAAYAGCLPGDLEIGARRGGKPFVAGPPAAVPLRFSLSHADGLALLAFGVEHDVGVDVERLRPVPEVEDVGRAVFTDGELAELRATPAPARCRAFLERWTRKEAVVKALGDGLAAMSSFAVTRGPGEEIGRLARPGGPGPRSWRVRSVAVDPAYAAAIAVAGEPPARLEVRVRRSSLHRPGTLAG